jgi:glycosyltransferase involved in cell wall biosynthesis
VPLVLALGEPRVQWDIGVLIEACRSLLAKGVSLRCEVVGPMRDLLRTQAQIDRHGLHDCIRLVGPLTEGQLAERYSRAAVFVQLPSMASAPLPSGIPRGLLEAMAMGLPVIAERTRVAEECVTHGSDGWLVSRNDPNGLFEAVHAVLARPRLGERFGRQARETVIERFDNDVNLRTLQQLLENASRRMPPASVRAPGATRNLHTGRRPTAVPAQPGRGLTQPELHHA